MKHAIRTTPPILLLTLTSNKPTAHHTSYPSLNLKKSYHHLHRTSNLLPRVHQRLCYTTFCRCPMRGRVILSRQGQLFEIDVRASPFPPLQQAQDWENFLRPGRLQLNISCYLLLHPYIHNLLDQFLEAFLSVHALLGNSKVI